MGSDSHRDEVQIRLIKPLAVDRQPGVRAALDCLSAHAMTFDQVVLWRDESDERVRSASTAPRCCPTGSTCRTFQFGGP